MADFYPIIAKAVSALDRNTEDARRKLYERARAALVAQMRGADPALNPSDILIARMSLEEAIGKVEAEARRERRAHRPTAAPSTSPPRGGTAAAPRRPAMQDGERGRGQLMRFWTRVLGRDDAPGDERTPRGEGRPGHSSGETDRGQSKWLSEILARASREEGGSGDDQAFAPPGQPRRNR